MALPVSPLAPAQFPDMPAIDGVDLRVARSGLRYRDRDDVLLMRFAAGTTVAGVFTRSATRAAPVDWCRQILPRGEARAFVVNAGNANAFTGEAGMAAVRSTARAAAALAGCDDHLVFVASTGVIGQPLPRDAIAAVLPQSQVGDWQAAARAIMTTDTFPKGAAVASSIGGVPVQLAGIAKGSGMIAPDMATMIAVVATDARLPAALLQRLLSEATERSFNRITVDGDASTNDTLLLMATGRASNEPVAAIDDPRLAPFREALTDLLIDLALLVVRDGEGAQKLIEIRVTGAADDGAARRIARTIGNSPLVKTAIAGEDANWGRIVMAVGNAGERVERDRLSVAIGGIAVAAAGSVVPGYDEGPVAAHMRGRVIRIVVDLGLGPGQATCWTCDLTHGYIDINAAYRS